MCFIIHSLFIPGSMFDRGQQSVWRVTLLEWPDPVPMFIVDVHCCCCKRVRDQTPNFLPTKQTRNTSWTCDCMNICVITFYDIKKITKELQSFVWGLIALYVLPQWMFHLRHSVLLQFFVNIVFLFNRWQGQNCATIMPNFSLRVNLKIHVQVSMVYVRMVTSP